MSSEDDVREEDKQPAAAGGGASSGDDEDSVGSSSGSVGASGSASDSDDGSSSDSSDSSSSSSSSWDSTDSDPDFPPLTDREALARVTDVPRLQRRLARQRRQHHRRTQRLGKQAKLVKTGRASIGAIVEQITAYKTALERERAELAAEVKSRRSELERERERGQQLQQKTAGLVKEREELVASIAELEKSHSSALSSGDANQKAATQENLENLQTLMDELQRIEESNAHLEETYENAKQQIANEKKSHTQALEALIAEKEALEQQQEQLKTAKNANMALVEKIKALKRAEGRSSAHSSAENLAAAIAAQASDEEEPAPAADAAGGSSDEDQGSADNPDTAASGRNLKGSAADGKADSGSPAIPETRAEEVSSKVYSLVCRVTPEHAGKVVCQELVSVKGKTAAQQMQLWCGSSEGNIRVWADMGSVVDMGGTGKHDDRISGHKGGVAALLEVRGRERVFSVGREDGYLYAWSAAPGKSVSPVKRIKIAKDASHPDGAVLLPAFVDRFGPRKTVSGLFLVEMDQFVGAGCTDGVLRLWDERKSTKVKKELRADSPTGALLCAAKVGNLLWVGTAAGLLVSFNTTTLKAESEFPHPGPDGVDDEAGGEGVPITSLVAVGSDIWSCNAEGVLCAWDVKEGLPTSALNLREELAQARGLEPDSFGAIFDNSLMWFRTAQQVWCGGPADSAIVLSAKDASLIECFAAGYSPDAPLSSLSLDKKGRVWAATGDMGLSVFTRKK